MSIKKEDVEEFLSALKQKMNVFDVIFQNREKNLQALLDLEISPAKRKEILKELRVSDYFRGPVADRFGSNDLWEFGKNVKGREVYIKITMGIRNKPVICISFHVAEHKIKYPFK